MASMLLVDAQGCLDALTADQWGDDYGALLPFDEGDIR
jgi:hypothetical protein